MGKLSRGLHLKTYMPKHNLVLAKWHVENDVSKGYAYFNEQHEEKYEK